MVRIFPTHDEAGRPSTRLRGWLDGRFATKSELAGLGDVDFSQQAADAVAAEVENRDLLTQDAAGAAYAPRDAVTAPRGARFVAIGDSQTAGGDNRPQKLLANTWQHWLAAQSGGRLDYVANLGSPGDTTGEMVARFQQDVPGYAPDVVSIRGGSNDMSTGVTVDEAVANIDQMVTWTRVLGAVPIVETLLPIADPTTTGRRNRMLLSERIKHLAATRNVLCVDSYAGMADPLTGDWADPLYAQSDGVHLAVPGMRRLADLYLAAIEGWPVQTRHAVTAADPLNLMPNPLLTDTDGDGLADGWQTNGTVTALTPTVVTRAGVPGNMQRFTIAATATNQGGEYKHGDIPLEVGTDYDPGDRVRLSCRVNIERTSFGNKNLRAYVMVRQFSWGLGSYDTSRELREDSLDGGVFDIHLTMRESDVVLFPIVGIKSISSGGADGAVEVGALRVLNLTRLGLVGGAA